jgi:hypothetical protein
MIIPTPPSFISNPLPLPHLPFSQFKKQQQIPEYAIQASIAILSTLTGNWLYGFLNLTLTAYHTHLLLKRQHLVDVTEIFRLVGMKRKQGSVKMVTYLVFFVWALYRLLGVGVRIYMTPEGRSAAKKVMQQQASFY